MQTNLEFDPRDHQKAGIPAKAGRLPSLLYLNVAARKTASADPSLGHALHAAAT